MDLTKFSLIFKNQKCAIFQSKNRKKMEKSEKSQIRENMVASHNILYFDVNI
jgi:hypothetical protein